MKGGIAGHPGCATMRQRSAGFTVVELMITLTISGFLFVSIAVLLQTRQGRAEFNQAVTSMAAQMEQIATEVENGYFGDPGSVDCVISGTTVDKSRCMYIGKLVRFRLNDSKFAVYTIVGSRSATSIASSNPYAADVEDTRILPAGLRVININGSTTTTNAVAFLSQFGTDATGSASGSRAVQVAAPLSSNLSAALSPPTSLSFSATNPSDGIRICFKSGTTDQWLLLTIGGGSASRTVNTEIRSTTC